MTVLVIVTLQLRASAGPAGRSTWTVARALGVAVLGGHARGPRPWPLGEVLRHVDDAGERRGVGDLLDPLGLDVPAADVDGEGREADEHGRQQRHDDGDGAGVGGAGLADAVAGCRRRRVTGACPELGTGSWSTRLELHHRAVGIAMRGAEQRHQERVRGLHVDADRVGLGTPTQAAMEVDVHESQLPLT